MLGSPPVLRMGSVFGRLVVAPQVTVGHTWAAAHMEAGTVLTVWELDKDFKSRLSVHAASVGRRSENLEADQRLVRMPADWKHKNIDYTVSKTVI